MSTQQLIAVVDDEVLYRSWITEHLNAEGYAVWECGSGKEALELIQAARPALMLLDLRLPDANGLELLAKFREIDREMVVIIVTAYGEVETAVDAVKAGAYHFLQKPIDLDDLLITIDKSLEARRLRQEVAVLRQEHRWRFAQVELVGRSPAMRQIAATVEKLAASDSATVLLLGESGTGKDLVARAIHARSGRCHQPFLEINCTALPEHLVESELFGHERGAFTDAADRKKGLAELADGGTLFLDEIGHTPPGAQAKLLRFLEDSKFRRLGGTKDISVDVRVIAATNRDLENAIAEHTFRSDLYYRLNVVPVRIPPLRERPEDIAPLAIYFVETLAREVKRAAPTLITPTITLLESYSWPGNARELRNMLERIMILEDDHEIRPEHLPPEIRNSCGRSNQGQYACSLPPEGLSLEDVERDLIWQALARTHGNVSHAAKLLGISRDTLRYRLKKYGYGNGLRSIEHGQAESTPVSRRA